MAFRTSRREFLGRAAAAGVLAGVAGCSNPFGGSSNRAAIGLPTPQSGPLAQAGKAGLRGAEVAIDEVNAERDQAIELVQEDGQASTEEARNVVQSMIDDGVSVFTGTFSSDVSNAVSDLAEEEEVPFVTAISVAPQITDSDDDYTFRLTGNTTQKLTGLAQFFEAEGVGAVGIVAADYSMGRSGIEFMNANASDYGFSVEHEAAVPLSTNNFVPELRNVDTDAIDAMFFPFPGGNGPTLIQQAREQGIFDAVDYVVGHDSYGTQLYKGALGDGIESVYNWGVDLSNERSQAASQTMQDRHDVPMDALSLPNYDAVHMIADAVDQAGGFDPQGVRDAIQNTSYDAAAGWSVEFDDAGDNTQYRMLVSQWRKEGGSLANDVVYTSDVIRP